MSDEQSALAKLTQQEREAIAEVKTLARLLAQSYAGYVAFLVQQDGKTVQDAILKAGEYGPQYLDHILRQTPEDVSWLNLNALDPEALMKKWGEIKNAAHDEIASGIYAADPFDEAPYMRARFLAIRAAFKDQWQPVNDGERLLVDMLAQLFCAYSFWLGVLQSRSYFDVLRERDYGETLKTGKRKQTTLVDAEAEEHAANMADRFNRLFLRTLRGLRDLRRYAPTVMIQSAGQVNIGGQQVNAARLENDK